MTWALAAVSGSVLAVAAFSGRLEGSPITPPMLFLLLGLVLGPEVLGGVDVASNGGIVRTLANATLTVVLFLDASRIDLRALGREFAVPIRLLGIGLPLTIVGGGALAAVLFGGLTTAEAFVLAVVLAPTDAALGQAVVTDKRLPSPVRQGLNVESGLNDGICVPLLFVAIAAAEAESSISSATDVVRVAAEEIGYGALAGVGVGLLTGTIILMADRWRLIAPAWRPLVPVAGAGFAYGIASVLDGSGFIAAFVAGLIFGALLRGRTAEIGRFGEELGDMLNGVTFLFFGAVLLGPTLAHVSWQIAIYAILSLTVVRALPVAIAMVGSRARAPTVAFLGWFGPRGLASIVFAVVVVEASKLPGEALVSRTAYLAVGLSTLAHGITASPLAARYERWLSRAAPASLSKIEVGEAPAIRARGARSLHTRDPVVAGAGGGS